MLASDSTHIEPTGAQLPSATAFLMRSQMCGWCSLTQAYCWACEQENTNSGYSPASSVTFAKVRDALRTVSRSGHSQAESMCACPVADSRCALAWAGRESTSASSARAPAAVAGTSCRSSASSANSRARRISWRRGSCSGSSRISSARTSMSRTRCQTSSSNTARSAEPKRYSGRSPAVSTSPSTVGSKPCSTAGLAAASSSSRTGSPPAAGEPTGTWRLRGCTPLIGTPAASYTSPSAWKPGWSAL